MLNVEVSEPSVAGAPPLTEKALRGLLLAPRRRHYIASQAEQEGTPVELFASAKANILLPQITEERSRRLRALFEKLSAIGVRLPEPSITQSYLDHHPDMVGLVDDLCRAIVEEFCQTSQVSLEVYRDPESRQRHLVVMIRQSPYDSNIIDRADSVMDHFSDALTTSSGWVHVSTDFQPPR
jgi:hypothetical protein